MMSPSVITTFLMLPFLVDAALPILAFYTGIEFFNISGIFILTLFCLIRGTDFLFFKKLGSISFNQNFLAVFAGIAYCLYGVIRMYGNFPDPEYGLNYYLSIYIAPIVCVVVSLVFPYSVYNKVNIYLIIIVSMALIIFGLFQYVLNDSMVYLPSYSALTISSLDYLQSGDIRASSLFSSGLNFGFFINFVMCLYLSCDIKFNKWIKFIVALVVFVALYATYTRNAYLAVFLSIMYFVLYKINYRYLLKFFPVMSVFIGLLISAVENFSPGDGGLGDSSTLRLRQDTWVYIFDVINSKGVIGWIKGVELMQTNDLFIDNTYIALISTVGILGLILVIFMYILMWVKAISFESASNYDRPSLECLLLCSMPATSFFNLTIFTFWYLGLAFSVRFRRSSC